MIAVKTTSELLDFADSKQLYQKLIEQLNKDFLLSNLTQRFESELSPQALKETLKKVLERMLIDAYDDYLNLMYRIDVSEKELSKVRSTELADTADQLTFIILKREFQKVWFKSRL